MRRRRDAESGGGTDGGRRERRRPVTARPASRRLGPSLLASCSFFTPNISLPLVNSQMLQHGWSNDQAAAAGSPVSSQRSQRDGQAARDL